MKVENYRAFAWIIITAILWLVFVAVPSAPQVRNWLAAPLVVHEENACGDICYVMAGGGSLWERLDAAADLIQMKRVPRILLMRDNNVGPFSFKTNSSWTRSQWATDYLAWRGVPVFKDTILSQTEGFFGTLQEARTVAKQLPRDVKTLVVVSSAPHMRRTVMAFKRSLPADVKVVPYAATSFEQSHEMFFPIWVEYLKLLVYFLVA